MNRKAVSAGNKNFEKPYPRHTTTSKTCLQLQDESFPIPVNRPAQDGLEQDPDDPANG